MMYVTLGASHLAFVYKANQITEEKTLTTDVNTTRSNISLIYPTQDGIDKLIIGRLMETINYN